MSLPIIRSEGVPVLWRDHPFRGEVKYVLIHAHDRMPSIAEIVAGIPDLPDDIRLDGDARINGIIVPRELWGSVRPKFLPGRVGVTLHHSIQKGGNTGTIIGITALIAAAAVTGGAALPFLGGLGLTGAALTLANAGLAASIGIVGSLAASALAPPPVSDTPIASDPGPEFHNASLGGNGVSKGQPLQRVIGTYKVAPQRLTDPLIEQIGTDLWVECIYGLAGPHEIEEVYFDGQLVDVSTNNNVLIETREGWVAEADLTLITRQSKTDTVPINLSQHQINTALAADGHAGSRLSDSKEAFHDLAVIGGVSGPGDATRTIDVTKIVPEWHRFSTRASPDEFWITMEYQQGLYNQNPNPSAGVFYYNGNAVRLRMRRKGDSTWINLPELHISGGLEPRPLRVTVKLMWSDQPDPAIPTPVNLESPGFYIAYKNVPGRTVDSPVTAGWTADARFSGGAVVNASRDQALSQKNPTTTNVRNVWLFEDRAELYLGDTGTFVHTGSGIWEIEVRQSEFYLAKALWGTGSPNSDTDSPGSYTYWDGVFQNALADGNVHDFFEYRAMAANDYHTTMLQSQSQYKATIVRRANIWNEYPIVESGANEDRMALIAIKVRNQQVNQITVLASGYIHRWNGTNWNSYGTSSNPAENFREVLVGVLGKQPQDTTAINDTNLLAWMQHCVDNDYTIDTVVAGKSYRDVLKLIAAAGWARERDAEQWGVIWDYDRSAETPGQIFTAREVNEFSIRKPFAKIPDGLRATFLNEDDDFNSDEVVVLDPYNGAATEYGIEEVSYAAFTDPTKVAARALFDIKQAHKRQPVYQFKVDTLAIMAERNDLIGVNYDTLSRRYASARIRTILTSGGNVTGLVLDGTVNDLPTTAYARIRKKSGAGYIDKQVVAFANATDTIMFTTPFANPGTTVLDVDAVVWLGDITETERRLIITGIAPGADFTSIITAVDEAPEIFS